MKRFIPTFFATIFLLSSCTTALEVAPVTPIYETYKKANMEFIGFKNVRKNHYLIKDFGAELERRGVAVNRQDYYMGVYSLQELETYKPTMRYVSFVDVSNLHSAWNDSIRDKDGLAVGGWVIAGITCFTLFPVYVPMICAANQNYCELDVMCNCAIQIYDTIKKEIVLSIPVGFRDTQVLKGQYSHKKTDRTAVSERSRNLIYNEFFKYFDRAYQFLEDMEKSAQ